MESHHQIVSLSATSSYLLNVPGDGDTTTPLLQCSTTLSTKKFSQILSPNLFLHHLRPEELCCLSLPKIFFFFPFPRLVCPNFYLFNFFFYPSLAGSSTQLLHWAGAALATNPALLQPLLLVPSLPRDITSSPHPRCFLLGIYKQLLSALSFAG